MEDFYPLESQAQLANDPQRQEELVRMLDRKIRRINDSSFERVTNQRRDEAESERFQISDVLIRLLLI